MNIATIVNCISITNSISRIVSSKRRANKRNAMVEIDMEMLHLVRMQHDATYRGPIAL